VWWAGGEGGRWWGKGWVCGEVWEPGAGSGGSVRVGMVQRGAPAPWSHQQEPFTSDARRCGVWQPAVRFGLTVLPGSHRFATCRPAMPSFFSAGTVQPVIRRNTGWLALSIARCRLLFSRLCCGVWSRRWYACHPERRTNVLQRKRRYQVSMSHIDGGIALFWRALWRGDMRMRRDTQEWKQLLSFVTGRRGSGRCEFWQDR